ncbi:MAG: hypothetical protein IPL76_10430 [Gemmatimonadetes bacterium]|nr:hypothetical protein [Gemmatimonadota bacterium]
MTGTAYVVDVKSATRHAVLNITTTATPCALARQVLVDMAARRVEVLRAETGDSLAVVDA